MSNPMPRTSMRLRSAQGRGTESGNPTDGRDMSAANDVQAPQDGAAQPAVPHTPPSKTASRRSQLELRVKHLEALAELEREMDRRRIELKELERQKLLLQARADLESVGSVSGGHRSGSSKVGSNLGLGPAEEGRDKVERWINENERSVPTSSSPVVTLAVQQLADSLRHAVQPTPCRQLPLFSGKPDEWPMFYSAYEKTCHLFGEDDNLARVRNSLVGDAFNMVKPLFVSNKNLQAIIKTLQMRFGRPEFILESMMNRTRKLLPVKEDDTCSLIEFSTNILNLTSTADSLNLDHYMVNPQLLNECLSKLPYSLKYRWAEHVSNNNLDRVDMKDFSTWLEKQCSVLSIYFRPPEENASRRKPEQKQALTNPSNVHSFKVKCVFCPEDHQSERCKVFRKAEVSERWKMVGDRKICFFCFRNHPLRFCKTKKACGINGCKLFHHRLLHTDSVVKSNPVDSKSAQSKEVITNHIEGLSSNRVLLRVCPVTLFGPSGQIDTFALLDDGSTVSLIDSEIANKLGLKGKIEPLTTCWSNSTRHFDTSSRSVKLRIKGLYEDDVFTMRNVRTQSPLDLPRQTVDTVKIRERWSHLKTIDQPLPSADSKPTILIGQDNCDLILTRKIVEGPPNSPVLSWSYLGWALHGKCFEHCGRVDLNFTLTSFEDDKLHKLVKESLEIDNYGVTRAEEVVGKSPEDERAIKILEKTTKKVGNHYESGLLWKSDEFKYPPSYSNALKRLKTIERKMERDSNFRQRYTEKIEDYIEKGYVRKLTKEEANVLTERTYYLPHFGVINPNKPDKLRLVFDAAAKSHGISFNDALISGPDLLNSLPSVLVKFRLGKYAIVGDIKEMFHQVWIRDEDVNAQRFLWRSQKEQDPDTYLMKAMTFGSTCSPSTALYVVNHNAKQFEAIYPEASRSILTKEYMDDLLDSTDSVEEARRRILQITEIHQAGGFQMCNWLSNSKEVLQDVPEICKANSVKQLKGDTILPTERVLGMWWNAESDQFVFHRISQKITKDISYPTKREVLRTAMSIFDPLGIVCPTTIKGRLLVQEIWQLKSTWDEVLPHEICQKWESWLEEVKNLQTFQIPRCYFESVNLENISLHIFVDASQEAFATVVYLVKTNCDDDSYNTMLVSARAKVAPLKPITIPRLELQAAVLGCRLANRIQTDIGIQIVRRVFWSDSVSVLHWIRSDANAYKQFVSNRLGEIQRLSKPEEWKWVPSKQNPADMATRSNRKFGPNSHHEWIRGPTFLTCGEDKWPEQPLTLKSTEDLEVKRQFVGIHKDMQLTNLINVNKFSSWEKLTRTLAWVLRYTSNLQRRTKLCNKEKLEPSSFVDYNKIPELQPEEIKTAETILLQAAQEESFSEEKYMLVRKRPLLKSSPIYKLSPFLEESTGLMKIVTRTENAPEFGMDQKQPILLDGKNHISKLIIKMYHENCFHQGTETVINEVRKRFWITNLRCAVKRVKNKCMKCRINNAKPKPPQMAPLPVSRVSKVQHPFFYTGVDYFGPIEVSVGRRREKRYGVLFTCLSTRAIHLEVAHSLSTESCVMAIQRFIGRRPCPSEIFSDNGTNFTATEKELRNAVKLLNNAQIQRNTARLGIKWNFIPPRAPHMGGCWERLVRSVKTALMSAIQSQYPTDEELQTILVRIEFILNSRPLTHVSMDPQDQEPLTPNHFLREAFQIPIIEDKLCKRQLARVKTLLDSFWKRWLHEYLPCLTRRCKWHERTAPPQIGDLAIIVDETNPRNYWPLGRISSVYPGKDGQIRVVDVSTTCGTFKRPLTKVAVLSVGGEDVAD